MKALVAYINTGSSAGGVWAWKILALGGSTGVYGPKLAKNAYFLRFLRRLIKVNFGRACGPARGGGSDFRGCWGGGGGYTPIPPLLIYALLAFSTCLNDPPPLCQLGPFPLLLVNSKMYCNCNYNCNAKSSPEVIVIVLQYTFHGK